MKRYEIHIRIIDRETDATYLETQPKATYHDAIEVLDNATTWLEVFAYQHDEPSEAQLQRMARGDHYPDYTYTMAEARKLK